MLFDDPNGGKTAPTSQIVGQEKSIGNKRCFDGLLHGADPPALRSGVAIRHMA
jgi:hypothetical protein